MTQETDLPSDRDLFKPDYHFSLEYKPDKAVCLKEGNRSQPNPPGLSGSLVWNTHSVEFFNNQLEWSPEAAEVTGIVWGWPSSNACLVATRVEHIRLKEMIANL